VNRTLLPALAVACACGHPATPGPRHEPPPPVAIDAGAPDAPVEAGEATLPAGCHEAGDGALIYPPFEDDAPSSLSYRDGKGVHTGAFDLCDLPDRVVVVDSKSTSTVDPMVMRLTGAVIATPRGRGATARYPIAGGSQCVDRCNGAGGGYAGCSVGAGCTIKSAAPGASVVSLGLETRTGGDKAQAGCGPIDHDYIGLCSTRDRLVLMDTIDCKLGKARGRFRLRLRSYDRGAPRSDGSTAAAPSFERNGDYFPPGSKLGIWSYRFPEAGDGAGDMLLTFTVGAHPDATLTTAGATEPCVAFSFAPRAL
jgi:hypothetical protein